MTQGTNLATNLGVQMIAEISVTFPAAHWPTVIVQLKRNDKEFFFFNGPASRSFKVDGLVWFWGERPELTGAVATNLFWTLPIGSQNLLGRGM